MDITRFDGEYEWLSNMHMCDCHYAGKVFKSSEHLYQWLKTAPGWWQDRIFDAPHGKVAKRLAAHPKCPKAKYSDWNMFRLECMETALKSKFDSNAYLRDRLIATAPAELVEGNYWGDTFWGVCKGAGTNYLGNMLMGFRTLYMDIAYEQHLNPSFVYNP